MMGRQARSGCKQDKGEAGMQRVQAGREGEAGTQRGGRRERAAAPGFAVVWDPVLMG